MSKIKTDTFKESTPELQLHVIPELVEITKTGTIVEIIISHKYIKWCAFVVRL